MSFFFFQAEDGIRYLVRSRGLGDVYKRQDDYAELTAFIERLLAQNDIVVVDERLARLEEVLDLSLIHI